MSRKQKIVAQKMKNVSDPALARTHKEGAIVELVQPSTDKNGAGIILFIFHDGF